MLIVRTIAELADDVGKGLRSVAAVKAAHAAAGVARFILACPARRLRAPWAPRGADAAVTCAATCPRRPLPACRAASCALAAAAIGGLTWLAFSRAFSNYDTLYSLIWGRDLAGGDTPDYEVTLAPTPHPLAELAGIPLSLLGEDAGYTAMLALALFAWGAFVWECSCSARSRSAGPPERSRHSWW